MLGVILKRTVTRHPAPCRVTAHTGLGACGRDFPVCA